MAKITKRAVEAAEPNGRDYFLWCDELPGFGVRIFASGRRSYLIQYRAGGRSRRVTIGLHGALTADEARREAKALLGQVARGEDPAEERITRRAAMTVADLCTAYVTAAEAGLIMGKGGQAKKTSTLYVDRGRIERHIKPLLGKRLVRDLTPVDVQRFVRDVQAGKTAVVEKTGFRGKAVVEGGAGTAARTVGLLGGILSYAVSEGVIPTNPAAGVKRPADKRRTRRLSEAEYKALGKALTAAEDDGERWQGIAGIRLLALTGCRLGEIAKLRWSEVDAEGSCLRLQDSKEGASVRPIGGAVVALLAGLERVEGSPFVLPAARGDGPFGSLNAALERITARAKLEGVTAHTLGTPSPRRPGISATATAPSGRCSGMPVGRSPAGTCTTSMRCWLRRRIGWRMSCTYVLLLVPSINPIAFDGVQAFGVSVQQPLAFHICLFSGSVC